MKRAENNTVQDIDKYSFIMVTKVTSEKISYTGDVSNLIDDRGKGIGTVLLKKLEEEGLKLQYNKFVLFTLPINELGQSLYKKMGYRTVVFLKNMVHWMEYI